MTETIGDAITRIANVILSTHPAEGMELSRLAIDVRRADFMLDEIVREAWRREKAIDETPNAVRIARKLGAA